MTGIPRSTSKRRNTPLSSTVCRATLKLAEKLGKVDEAAFITKIIPLMESAARKNLWDEAQGEFVSGPKREITWASQAWMVLAGVPSPEQAKRALTGVMTNATAAKPVTPYLHHYVVEALLAASLHDDAMRLMQSYWGGMIRKGAHVPGSLSAG